VFINTAMMEQVRSSTYKINPVILNRCSPRSMTGEANNFDVIAKIAIGKRDGKDKQPSGLQESETPSPRKPLEQMIHERSF
jgi:hypothetical protein